MSATPSLRSLLRAAQSELRTASITPASWAEGSTSEPLARYMDKAVQLAEAKGADGKQAKVVQRRTASLLGDLELTVKSARVHAELLTRYNPVYGKSEQERIRATANRVGLEVPIEYKPKGE